MRREGNRVEFVKKRLMTNKYKIYITVIQESILNKNSIIAEWFEKKILQLIQKIEVNYCKEKNNLKKRM